MRLSRTLAARASRVARACLAWAFAALLCAEGPAFAAEPIAAQSTQLVALEDGWGLNLDFNVKLSSTLEDAVQRGVILLFLAEAVVDRHRWWWFDEEVADPKISMRLSYNLLTRQYRVGIGDGEGAGALTQRFDTLEEAVRVIGSVRNWRLGGPNLLSRGERYTFRVRMRLDTSQLPKPFQLNALTARDWQMTSDWVKFVVTP